MKQLHLVQEFKNDKWQTISASTFLGDAEETYEMLQTFHPQLGPIRQCELQVDDLDFLMVHARDVKVVRSTA